MPSLLRTRLLAPEPGSIALTVHGRARIRVCGNAYGFVRCQGMLRWVWGAFDETFQLCFARSCAREHERPGVHIMALGLGGLARSTLRFVARHDLTVTRLPTVGRVRWSPLRIPRLAPLSAVNIRRGLSQHERE
jgi:hypothetical protein